MHDLRNRSKRHKEVLLASLACLLIAAAGLLIDHPVILLAAALVPLALLATLRMPFLLVLGFALFSFFRIHEVLPQLYPLRLPQLLALGALVSLSWGLWSGAIKAYWTREMSVFALFFLLVTAGLFFASNRGVAMGSWTGTFSKIFVMTIALAWLTQSERAFRISAQAIILAGMLVGAVAVMNKITGIGLVEGTRVTIGRDIGSMLGDPNDLALVLLFPASFALAVFLTKGQPKLFKLLSICGFVLVFCAIIATQSRGGLLGICAVMATFAWRRIPSKGLLLGLGVLGLLLMFSLAEVSDRTSGGAHEAGIDESAMGRIYAWQAAWGMALSNPMTGVGINNFLHNYWEFSPHWDGQNHAVHSTWFGVMAETGFLGLIVFLTMVGLTLQTAIRTVALADPKSTGRPTEAYVMAQAVQAGLLGFIVSGTFLTMGFTWPFYILLAFTIATAHHVQRLSRNESQNKNGGPLLAKKID